MKISTEHRDALNEALDETAGYEGDVYVFDVKHIEILRSAVIAMLEAQIATVAPAVDAQPVASNEQIAKWARRMTLPLTDSECVELAQEILASAQSEGLRKDAERLDWLDRNMFHREMNEWDTRIHHGETMWVMFAPNGVQGSARNVIDAVLPQHNTGEKYD